MTRAESRSLTDWVTQAHLKGLLRALIPYNVSTVMTYHPLKVPLPNTITWRLGFHIWILGQYIQSMALPLLLTSFHSISISKYVFLSVLEVCLSIFNGWRYSTNKRAVWFTYLGWVPMLWLDLKSYQDHTQFSCIKVLKFNLAALTGKREKRRWENLTKTNP